MPRQCFDAVSKLGARLQKYGNRAVRAAGATIHWGIDSSAEIEAIDPRLRTLTVVSAFDLDGGKRLPTSFRVTSKVNRSARSKPGSVRSGCAIWAIMRGLRPDVKAARWSGRWSCR